MNSRNKAEIISIGTELLMGETVDTNAHYLASQLQLLGIELGKITVVGDDRERLGRVLRQAIERAALILTSGGLGPTEDDLTRECIAEVLEEELAVDAELEEQLRALFSRLVREMPSPNVKQAMLIPSAKSLPNPQGTAPGWWVEKDGKTIIALPGPPRELKPMWQNEVEPRLQSKFSGRAIITRTLKIFGIPEAKMAEMVAPFFDSDNPSLGIYAKPDGIHLRLIALGEGAHGLLDKAEEQLEEILTHHVWGKDNDELPEVIGKLLVEKGLNLATMEDGTRGLLASMVTNTDSSARYYRGGLIACSDEMKVNWGVPAGLIGKYGAISAEVAEAMAVIARDNFSAGIGLSVTGIEGIDSSESEVPGLAFIGMADSSGTISWRQSNLPHRDVVRNRLAIATLFRLRRRLID